MLKNIDNLFRSQEQMTWALIEAVKLVEEAYELVAEAETASDKLMELSRMEVQSHE